MNIFSRKTEEPVYSKEIAMVHDEFNSAGEKLYQEALKIINSTSLLNEEKVQRLIKLGFTATKEVVDAQEVIAKRKINEEMVETIAYYRTKYPLNKFITEDQVKEICSKYGLIYGKISSYTGFVPERNMKAIEAFAFDEDDIRAYKDHRNGSMWRTSDRRELKRGEHKVIKMQQDYKRSQYIDAIAKNDNNLADYYASSMMNDYIYKDTDMLIAAPKKDFNITEKHEIKNFRLSLKPVPDPVVLAPVIGGYLIVTAWGDEASDPLVRNEINN